MPTGRATAQRTLAEIRNYATVGCHPETLGLECAGRGKSHGRASEPDQSRARLRHSEAANAPVFAIAFYGRPCGAGFCLAGSLGYRFLTPVRSATILRQNSGWQLLNQTEEHKENALPPFYPRAPPWASGLAVHL